MKNGWISEGGVHLDSCTRASFGPNVQVIMHNN
jgi:hypothetical protein